MVKKVNGKIKGSSFELKVAHDIADAIKEPYGTKVRRTPGSGSLLCRADIFVHHTVRHKFPWYLELKKRQTIRLEHVLKSNNDLVKWYEESKGKLGIDPDYDQMTTPTALVFAKNNMLPFIMMTKKDFFNMELGAVKFSFMMLFSCNEEDYIIVEWKKFLDIYRVPLDNSAL